MKGLAVEIDGNKLYIDGLRTSGNDGVSDMFKIKKEELENALEPIAKIGEAITSTVSNAAIDKVEFSAQLSIGIENNKLVFGLLKASSEAQLSVKFVLKP